MTEHEQKGFTEEHGYTKLLEVATPQLYRQNAFRALSLPVDVTMRDIKRQKTKLDMMRKLGTSSVDNNGYMSLHLSPDEDALSKAIQRLFDPETRLIDELFWFWPLEGGSSSDDALKLLGDSCIDDAILLWCNHEQSTRRCKISMHNLAVIYHLKALDLEYEATHIPLTGERVAICNNCWKKAYNQWGKLLDNEGFWSLLTARIRELNDPRLTTGMVYRIKNLLAKAILLINAKLAVRAAESNDNQEVDRHIKIMKDSGFKQSLVDEAIGHSVSPIRQRLKMILTKVNSDAKENPDHADKIAKQLLKDVLPLLSIIDKLLPKDDLGKGSDHDEISVELLQCGIIYVDETDDWKTFVELLELARPLVAGQSLAERIEKNLETGKNNLLFGTCFFCGESPADSESLAEVGMYGDVRRKQTFTGTKTTYSKRTVPVPRCAKCKEFHDRSSNIGMVGGIICALVVAVICLGAWGFEDGICAAIGLGFLGFFVGMFIVGTVSDWNLPKNIKSVSHGSNFFLVKELESQGWEVGDSP